MIGPFFIMSMCCINLCPSLTVFSYFQQYFMFLYIAMFPKNQENPLKIQCQVSLNALGASSAAIPAANGAAVAMAVLLHVSV